MTDYNPFEPDETPEERGRRVGRMIRENVDAQMAARRLEAEAGSPELELPAVRPEMEITRPLTHWGTRSGTLCGAPSPGLVVKIMSAIDPNALLLTCPTCAAMWARAVAGR